MRELLAVSAVSAVKSPSRQKNTQVDEWKKLFSKKKLRKALKKRYTPQTCNSMNKIELALLRECHEVKKSSMEIGFSVKKVLNESNSSICFMS